MIIWKIFQDIIIKYGTILHKPSLFLFISRTNLPKALQTTDIKMIKGVIYMYMHM